jgi:hypothetical protein
MDLVVKTVAAFCIGAALFAGAGRWWMSSVVGAVKSQGAAGLDLPQVKPAFSFDKTNFDKALFAPEMPKIDTRAAQGAWINSLGHQMSIDVRRAQDMAQPKNFSAPGMRRF